MRCRHALCFMMLHRYVASDGCCSVVTPGSSPRQNLAKTRAQYRAPGALPPGRPPAHRLLRLALPGRLMWRRLLRLTLPGRLMWRRLLRLTLPGRLMWRLLSSASQQATPERRPRSNSGKSTAPSCVSSARPRMLWLLLLQT